MKGFSVQVITLVIFGILMKAYMGDEPIHASCDSDNNQNENCFHANNDHHNEFSWIPFEDQSDTPFSTFRSQLEQFGIFFTRVNNRYVLNSPMNTSFSFTAHGSDFKLAGNISTNNILGAISPIFPELLIVQSSKHRFLWNIGDVVIYLVDDIGTLVNQSGGCYSAIGETFSQQEFACSAEKDISVALQMNPYNGVFRWTVQFFAEYFGDVAADCVPLAELSAVTPVTIPGEGTILIPFFVPYAQVFPQFFLLTNHFENVSFSETTGNEAYSFYGKVQDSDFDSWDSRCNYDVAQKYCDAFYTPFGFCIPPTDDSNGIIMPYKPTGIENSIKGTNTTFK